MNLPIEVVEAVNEGRCVLFVGPRYSGEALEAAGREQPDGRTQAKALGWKPPKRMIGARKTVVVPSVTEGAARYVAANGRPALVARIRGMLDASDAAPSDAHRTSLSRFPLIFTTNYDAMLERTAKALGGEATVCYRGDPIPASDPTRRVVYKLWGGFEKPESLVLTQADHGEIGFTPDTRRAIRDVIRRNVVFFVGYRPDEEHFERLWQDLTLCYGGELPRCHMAVSQGKINDYLWQKWVWRGLLMFTADPSECMSELDRQVS
ncbi:MAG: hypothetical protein ACI8S6_005863 [Myxococcota bacterium]|jgi:hypothetical protein